MASPDNPLEQLPFIRIPLYGPLGEGKFVTVDGDYDGEYFSQWPWKLMPNGYVARSSQIKLATNNWKQHYIYLAREVARPPAGMWVSYLDGDKLNCRSSNLISISPSESATNRPLGSYLNYRPKSGYRGVRRSPIKGGGFHYYVAVGAQNGPIYLRDNEGRVVIFTDPKAAARAYNEMAIRRWGERAVLNEGVDEA